MKKIFVFALVVTNLGLACDLICTKLSDPPVFFWDDANFGQCPNDGYCTYSSQPPTIPPEPTGCDSEADVGKTSTGVCLEPPPDPKQ